MQSDTEIPQFQSLLVAAPGAVGRIILNRPDKLNAITPAMLRELAQAANWFNSHTDVNIVVVSGLGRAFCAGFDLNGFMALEVSGGARETADLGRVMAESITNMRALTIAAIQGNCVGGGLVVAAACDLRIAGESVSFSIPEVDLGIPLAWGGIPRLVREIGPALTRELVLTCRPFGAEEAKAVRFLNKVVADDALESEAMRWAEELSRKPPRALLITKRDVNAATESMVSTAAATADADKLISALSDPAGAALRQHYLLQRGVSAKQRLAKVDD